MPEIRRLTHSDDPVQNGWESHKTLATISASSLVFNEILSIPPSLFNVEYVRLSNRFCGQNNIEMGGGGEKKKNKDVRDWKKPL